MSITTGKIHVSHPILAWITRTLLYPVMRTIGFLSKSHSPTSAYTQQKLASLREKIAAGETAYLLGITPGGHNTGAALVRVSAENGIELLGNHEEERFLGEKHCQKFPFQSLQVIRQQMQLLGIEISDIHAVINGWDYPLWVVSALESVAAELPGSLHLLTKHASPSMKPKAAYYGLDASRRIAKVFELKQRLPVINFRHHDNHACFSYATSPFSGSESPVIVLVIDGAGDDGAISTYLAQGETIEELYRNRSLWDSLGMMYGILSSTQGGWPLMQSEGRFMGAAAWGNMNRMTNPYYSQLRDIFHYGPKGEVYLNRKLANWHKGGGAKPYTQQLSDILGPPISPERMWNPDAVLNVDDIEHAPVTQDRVDKAAAVQLVFEDALFHIVRYLVQETGSHQIVLSGGTALNCIANMRLAEHFNEEWFERYTGEKETQLHLWIPPIPNDEGVAAGAAYQFAMKAGVPLGKSKTKLTHAFYCGLPPADIEIQEALKSADDVGFEILGNLNSEDDLLKIADLLAYMISQNGVVGLYQGAAETGPRALGHRSILANPANPETLARLNGLVKYR